MGAGCTETHALGSKTATFNWLWLLFSTTEPLCTQSVTLWEPAPQLAALSWDKVFFNSFSSVLSDRSSVNCVSAISASAILRLACSPSSRSCDSCCFWRRCSSNWSCCSFSWSLWSRSWWRRSFSKWSRSCSGRDFWSSISCFCFARCNELSCWHSSCSLRCFAISNSFCLWVDVFDVTELPDLVDTAFFVVLDELCDVLTVAGSESIYWRARFNTSSLVVVRTYNQVSCSLSREAESSTFRVSSRSWSCLLMAFAIASLRLVTRRSTRTPRSPFCTASSICWYILVTSDSAFSWLSSSLDNLSCCWSDVFIYFVFSYEWPQARLDKLQFIGFGLFVSELFLLFG